MTKRYHYIYMSIMVMVLILCTMACVFTSTPPQDTNMHYLEPTTIIQTDEHVRQFIFDVSEVDSTKNDIAFFTKHQFTEVYSDDTLIYEYTDDGDIWGHTNGAFWTFIDIPYGSSEIRLQLTAAYDEVKEDIPRFYIGDKLTIYQNVIRNSLPPIIISLLILIFGNVLILYWLFVSRGFDIGKSLLYLGIFSTLIGLYLLNETDAAIAIIQHRTGAVFCTYILLMTLCPTSIYFFREFLGTVEEKIWKIICGLSLSELIICTLLQSFDIIDLRQTLFITHILIGATALYILVTLIIKVKRREYSPMLKASLLSVAILSLSVFINLAAYYKNTAVSDTSIVSRMGFLIFIFILTIEAAKTSFALMEKGRHAKIFEELAITDTLTGLNNRNAYIRDIDALTNNHDVMIVTCDLNNLKKCNDTLGHNEGDAYILNAANIIRDSFSKYGSCYRIGGDEFVVMIKNALMCPIGELTTILEEKQDDYNATEPGFPMCISYGYAVFDSRIDTNLEQTRDRADALMYEYKRKSKES